MKKTGLKATKPALKSTLKKVKKKPVKSTRGGARPGAGRKPKFGEFQQIHVDTPVLIHEALKAAEITNKTGFILYLLANGLKDNQKLAPGQRVKLQKMKDQLFNTYQ